ncbi:hypothetical protein Bbelb_278130 [Branchiostoma belcheri]|nr:hypothetical protein Bbelb_278130 [Branchiostoma belcheri]
MAQDPVKCPTPGRLWPREDSPGLLERMASIQVHKQNIQEAEELGYAPLNCIDRRAEEAAMKEGFRTETTPCISVKMQVYHRRLLQLMENSRHQENRLPWSWTESDLRYTLPTDTNLDKE